MPVVGAAVVYVASLVPLVLMLRWRLRHRRADLDTRTPDGPFALVFGLALVAIAPLVGRAAPHAVVVAAVANGFAWVVLKQACGVALAELRWTFATRRAARSRATGHPDPEADRAERDAEANYRSVRYWHQEHG